MERNQEILAIAQSISKLLTDELGKRPYGANIIDELHAGENAHSRILKMLLQYNGGGKYPIYVKFLSLIKKNCPKTPCGFVCVNPYFANEDGRIDLLIKDGKDDKYAIIIENKVCGAGDQDKQLERYIEYIKNDVSLERIIVIYLTLDGQKQVSCTSLTEKAKEYLSVKSEDNGRYVELNYREHIIPWIEEIIPEMQVKEELLISALRQYLDYLKGICQMRESDEPIYDKIQTKMKIDLGLNSLEDSLRIHKEVATLEENIKSIINKQMLELLELKLLSPIRELFNEIELFHGAYIYGISSELPDFRFNIVVPSWKKTEIKTNYEGVGQIYGIIHKDVNEQVEQSVRDALRDNIVNDELHPIGRNSQWWPWYQVLQKSGINHVGSEEIYREIENGKIYHFFEKWLKEVADVTKGMDL